MACILVVDDEEAVLNLAGLVLSRAGHEVVSASTSDEALNVARESSRIDLVLLDMIIPGPPWNETLTSLLGIRPKMAWILSSGYSENDIRRSEGLTNDTLFLQKPYRAKDLIAIVAKALRTE